MGRRPSDNKYGAYKVRIDGMEFDSQKEFERYCELRILERAHKIQDLRRQVKYVLIPEQRELSHEFYKRGPKKGLMKPGKLLERECAYIADFVYFDAGRQKLVVEDVKGYRHGIAYELFTIKRKLMLYRYEIKVEEI